MRDKQRGDSVEVPEPPDIYKALLWSRDADISFFNVFEVPMWKMRLYLEMRDLEQEYGVQPEQQQDTMG